MADSDNDDEKPRTSIGIILLVAFIIIAVMIFIGATFIHNLFKYDAFESFYTASVYLSGTGDPNLPVTKGQKIFVALFPIIGGLIAIGVAVSLVVEVFNRVFNLN